MAEPAHMTRMQRFWSWLAVYLGKHAGVVAIVGLLVTLVLGFGTTKLSFATGQDSYLNAEDQVYKDNVAYQGLFGGQAMLALLTADQGKTVNDIMSPANQAAFDKISQQLKAHPDVIQGVITPKDALVWSDKLVQSPDGNPTNSIAGKALLAALQNDPTDAGKAARSADTAKTRERLNAVPQDQRVLTNPAWVDFLIHDNQGGIRKPLRAVFTDDGHAHEYGDAGDSQTPVFGNASDVLSAYGHTHDHAEAATLLDPQTRAILKQALDQMWQSEGELRQGHPDKALPYAYKALGFIKQVQQAERIYLARVGPDLPSIDETRRMTGKRDGLASRTTTLQAASRDDADVVARWRALADGPGNAAPNDTTALQRWLRAHPARAPDPLALQEAIDTLQRKPSCGACRAELRALLWPLLAPPPAAVPRRAAADAQGRRYLDALQHDAPDAEASR